MYHYNDNILLNFFIFNPLIVSFACLFLWNKYVFTLIRLCVHECNGEKK